MGMTKTTFSSIRIGANFNFRFGHKGERAGWIKTGRATYQDAKTGQRFSVGATSVEVVRRYPNA